MTFAKAFTLGRCLDPLQNVFPFNHLLESDWRKEGF